MELNFDKEMDALLRQTSRQEKSAPAAESHLDADELAAFAAGALPSMARARAVEHLVDCGNCRTTAANLVFFENEAAEPSSAASTVAAAPGAVETASLLDRIKTFFTVPMLAYGMAGLVLVFAGMLAVVFFRSASGDLQMAQANTAMEKTGSGLGKGMSSEGAETYSAAPLPMNSNSSFSSANSAMNTAAATPGGGPALPSSRVTANTSSNVFFGGRPADKELREDRLKDAGEAKPVGGIVVDGVVKAAEEAPAPAKQEQDITLAKPQVLDQSIRNQTQTQDNNVRNNKIMMPDGSDKDRQRATSAEAGANVTREGSRDEKVKQAPAPPPPPPSATKTEVKKNAAKKPKKKGAAAAEAEPAPPPSPTPKPPAK